MPGSREPRDVRDLSGDGRGRDEPDAGNGGQPANAVVAAKVGSDLVIGRGDLGEGGIDDPEVRLNATGGDLGQPNAGQKSTTAGTEQVRHRWDDPMVGEDRMDLALAARRDAQDRHTHANETSRLPDLERRHPRLREQIRAEQVRERLGVHGIVLDSSRRDRLGRKGVGHVRGDAGIGEHVREPSQP